LKPGFVSYLCSVLPFNNRKEECPECSFVLHCADHERMFEIKTADKSVFFLGEDRLKCQVIELPLIP
jgi:hypothetical protein